MVEFHLDSYGLFTTTEFGKRAKMKKNKYRFSDVKKLGHELLTSRAHINNLPLLITILSSKPPPHHALESLLSLHSFFTPLLPDIRPPSRPSPPSNKVPESPMDSSHHLIYTTWLSSNFDRFQNSLISMAVSPLCEQTLRGVVLDVLMDYVKLQTPGKLHFYTYHRLLSRAVLSPCPPDLLMEQLTSKYFGFSDVQYSTYACILKICKTLETDDGEPSDLTTDGGRISPRASMDDRIGKVYYLLSRITPDDGRSLEEWGSGEQSEPVTAKKMTSKFTKAWISFLRLPLPIRVYKTVLPSLHESVIPRLSSPIMLSDFFTKSYDVGGVVSVMALGGLYVLMTKHGLEYPNFYEKLYRLLTPAIFTAKHRARFLELLDSCLRSPLLPAYLVAAFAKRLSRLTLSSPPSGSLVVTAVIRNMLQRHPSISCLVHRDDVSGADPFRDEETDFMKSHALSSSLWETDAIRRHYSPPVSKFASSLEDDVRAWAGGSVLEFAVSDFSYGSYATLFEEEMRRRVKQVPVAFYRETPSSLFSEVEFPGWSFVEEETACGMDE